MSPDIVATAALYWISDESRPISGSVMELEQYPMSWPQPAKGLSLMPKLAAFPKAYMEELCVNGKMTLREWIDLASSLDIDGLEFYCVVPGPARPGRRGPRRARWWKRPGSPCRCSAARRISRTRTRNTDRSRSSWEKGWIEMTAALGGKFCRVLSGQRRPEVSRADGIRY